MSEHQALLPGDNARYGVSRLVRNPQQARIGIFSATFIIFNRLIGAGIFATPAVILAFTGSVGMSLFLWVVGTLFAITGMQVYIIWGTALPQSGGEKNYLEFLFPYPLHLVACMYAAYASVSAWSAGNSLVFGEYVCKALLGHEPSSSVLKLTSFGCLTFTFLLHGTTLQSGLRLQNILGVSKFFVICVIIVTGYVAFRDGIPTESGLPEDRWRAKENFSDIWRGTNRSLVALCTALYSIIWSFCGFSNVNYVLTEVENPVRTLRIAGPLAVIVVAVLYILSNIAYFAGASRDEIIGSGRLVVSLLMSNIWGEKIERWVDFGVALSALGNVLAVAFSQGRVNQESGKQGALPFGSFLASDRPRDAPFAGIGLHWFTCTLVILLVPSGDAYNFVVNVITYPLSAINAVISFGLIYLYLFPTSFAHPRRHHYWDHQSAYTLFCALFFGLASVFLIVVPLMPPPPGAEPYEILPYWTHAVGGWCAFGLGAIWWSLTTRHNRICNRDT